MNANPTIYLDYNATAPVRPEVCARMMELMATPANASSVHRFGREAKKHLENARKTIAERISVFPNEIIFTGSGTEANALALRGAGRRVLVSATEHASVYRHPGLRRDDIIPVNNDGIVELSTLEEMLKDKPPALVSIMLANNETGVIQPMRDITEICKKHGALLHTDAVQALGKIPLDFGALGVDMMTLSAHKCGGPVGAAALILRQDLAIAPIFTGGGQELGRRAGTENIPAIAGFATAVEKIDFTHMQKLRLWLDVLERGNVIFGAASPRLPNTTCIAMTGLTSEVQLMDFDLKGFAISAGSACSSGRVEPSHVLKAMNIPENLAKCAIRVSGGWNTAESDIISFADAWKTTYKRVSGNS